MKFALILTTSFFFSGLAFASSSSLIRAERACANNSVGNPSFIDCNEKAQDQADHEIDQLVRKIKKLRVSGIDAHNFSNLSKSQHYLNEEICAFRKFRSAAELATEVIVDGTGSDDVAASSAETLYLTIQELQRLEAEVKN